MHCIFCSNNIEEKAEYCYFCGESTTAPDSSAQLNNNWIFNVPLLPQPGDHLAPEYVIEEVAGWGGMGVVYRAHRRQFGDAVAIKVLKPRFAARKDLTYRFLKEARTTAQLKHKNILQIYTLNEGGDKALPYFAMEFLTGRSLRQLLFDKRGKKRNKLELKRALALMDEICTGVGAAHRHEKRIVHRDLKPDNIWVLPFNPEDDDKEAIKVLDFGIVKAREDNEESSWKTDPASVMGTYRYMSPEQCRGSDLDVRSDVYSLGVMLYEMLAGQTPFVSQSAQGYIAQHLTESPPPLPAELEVPHEIEEVIMRTLAKHPANRPADALMLRQELRKGLRAAEKRIEEEGQEAEQWQQRDTVIRELERRRKEREEKEREEVIARLRREAKEAGENGDWEGAVDKLRSLQSLRASPQEVEQELGHAERQRQLARLFEEGRAHYEDGRLREALKLFRQVQHRDSEYKNIGEMLWAVENGIREEEIRSLSQSAQAALDLEDWDIAIQQLQSLLKLAPGDIETTAKLNHALLQQRLAGLYLEGREHYRARQWQQAFEMFQALLSLDGGYKDAARLIEESQERAKEEKIKTLFQQAEGEIKKARWDAAIEILGSILALEPAQAEAQTKLTFVRRQQECAKDYSEGLKHYEARNWSAALGSFRRVESEDDSYRDIRKFIGTCQENLVKEKVAALALEAQAATAQEKWALAVELSQAILRLEPTHVDAKAILSSAIRQQEIARLYAAGIQHLKAGRWQEALNAFQRVQMSGERYKDVISRVEEARAQLTESRIIDKLKEANAFITQKNWVFAAKAVSEIATFAPSDARATAKLAEIRHKEQEEQQAELLVGRQRAQAEQKRAQQQKNRRKWNRRLSIMGGGVLFLVSVIYLAIYLIDPFKPIPAGPVISTSSLSNPSNNVAQPAPSSNQEPKLNDNWTPRSSFERDKEKPVSYTALSPDGERVVISSVQNVTIWHPRSEQAKPLPISIRKTSISATAVSPDGKFIAVAWDNDDTIELWEAGNGKRITSQSIRSVLGSREGVTVSATSLSFSADSRYLAVGCSNGQVIVFDTANNYQAVLIRGGKRITCIAFSPMSNLLAAGQESGVIRLWSMQDLKAAPKLLNKHKGDVASIAFSPDGTTLASGSFDEPDVLLWDVYTEEPYVRAVLPNTKTVSSLAFSPDGLMLAVGMLMPPKGKVNLWDLASQRRSSPWKTATTKGPVLTLAYSENGNLLAIGEEGQLILWDVSKVRE